MEAQDTSVVRNYKCAGTFSPDLSESTSGFRLVWNYKYAGALSADLSDEASYMQSLKLLSIVGLRKALINRRPEKGYGNIGFRV